MKKIPLFDLNYNENELNAVREVLESKWISCGPKCEWLERRFCELLDVNYAVSVSSCTSALHLALLALGIGKGDEVLVPSLTFVATANVIKYVGATPVFCDIVSETDLTISPVEIEKKLSGKTKAIIVMHYAGFSCAMNVIMKIAREHGLFVVEDACHGPLSEYDNQKLGTIGDIGCFSFYSNKNISAAEGGMVVTDSEEYAKKIKLLRSHGMTTLSYQRDKGHSTGYDVVDLGYNYRLDDIRASLALAQLDKLQEDYMLREKLRACYIQKLEDNNAVWIPFKDRREYVSNYIFPIVLRQSNATLRESIRQRLSEFGIQTSVHYPAVHLFSIYEKQKTSLPITEYVADSEITLPLYGSMELEDVVYVCDVLNKITEGL